MSVHIKMLDEGDGVTYGLSFSLSDCHKILEAQFELVIDTPSIGGSCVLKGENILAISYKNGSSGHGSIYTDYSEVCDQIHEQL